MKRLVLIASLLALPAVRPAMAAPAAATVEEVDTIKADYKRYVASLVDNMRHQDDARARSKRLADQIDWLKQQPQSARRDRNLQERLAESQALTDGEMARLGAQGRFQRAMIEQMNRRIDAELAKDTTRLPEAYRNELQRLRGKAAGLVFPPWQRDAAPKTVDVSADPLDGPRELRQKADQLHDSSDKLRREANRIASRLDGVERRRHLRERAGSLDDDMFGEATSNRRVARTTASLTTTGSSTTTNKAATPTTTTNAATDSNGAPAPPQSPAVNGPGTGGTGQTTSPANSGFAAAPTSRAGESTTLSNVVDPALLDEMNRADSVDDVDRQTRVLKRVQSQLESRAKDLDKRAKDLEARAAALQNTK